jgi:hypothetical protein
MAACLSASTVSVVLINGVVFEAFTAASGKGDADRRGANVIGHGTRARPRAAQGKCSGNWGTMLLKINEFKEKQKKFEISLDKNVESGIHSFS